MQPPKLPRGVPERATLRAEYVNCGRCPVQHGPYWYAYWREEGRLRKRYLGAPPASQPPELEKLDRKLQRRIRDVEDARTELVNEKGFFED
jgi:hypothetical protein